MTTGAGDRTAAGPRPWAPWLLTRAVALALGGLAVLAVRGNVFFDTTYYAHWAHGTLTGARVPYRDFAWEYPPGALPLMLLPGLYAPFMHDGHGSAYVWLYGALWVAGMLAVDATVLRSLTRRTDAAVRHPAVTLWVWGAPVLGAFSWARYDLLPAAAGVAALLAAGAGVPKRSACWSGLGATLKLWPSLLAPLQRSRSAVPRAVAQAAAVVAMTAAATFLLTGSSGYGQVLSYQARRGLQCESLGALPFLWLRHLHVAGYGSRFRFGAYEVTGPHVGLVISVTTAIYAAGLLLLGLAHLRLLGQEKGAELVALTAMALMMLTLTANKVFSPQYLLWLLGVLAAACVLDPTTWRPYVPWVLVTCGLTSLAFPWFYGDVLGHGWPGLLFLTCRDLLMIGLAAAVARELVRRLHLIAEAHGPTWRSGERESSPSGWLPPGR